ERRSPNPDGVGPILIFLALGSLGLPALLVSYLAADALAGKYRTAHRRQLRKALTRLRPEEQLRALLPLREERLDDTRNFVAPLLMELSRSSARTELSPASALIDRSKCNKLLSPAEASGPSGGRDLDRPSMP